MKPALSTTTSQPRAPSHCTPHDSPNAWAMVFSKPDDLETGALSPNPAAVRVLDAETIVLLVKQGEQLVEVGDFAAARPLFQPAAQADDAKAALALGATYDPIVFAGRRTVGINADVAKARFWYQKAASLGSAEARRRLDLLANR